MVTEQEKAFVEWWARNRGKGKGAGLWMAGLRWGLLLVGLTALSFVFGWHKQATMWARGHSEDNTGLVLAVAGLIIVVFMAIFYRRHKWEMYEQQYREILSKMTDGEKGPDGGGDVNNTL